MMMGAVEDQFKTLRRELDALGADLQRERVGIVAAMSPDAAATRLQFLLALAAATVLSIVIALIVARLIAKPVLRLTGIMGALARGDTSIAIPDAARGDEIGAMARALEIFKAGALEKASLEAEVEAERARRTARQQAVETLLAGFDLSMRGSLAELAGAAGAMQKSSAAMAEIAARDDGAIGGRLRRLRAGLAKRPDPGGGDRGAGRLGRRSRLASGALRRDRRPRRGGSRRHRCDDPGPRCRI